MADQPRTPTEVMMERFGELDDVASCMVLFRHKDGQHSYAFSDGPGGLAANYADIIGMLRYTQMMIEEELQSAWRKD